MAQLLLMMAAFVALPSIGKLVAAAIELLVKLVAIAVIAGLGLVLMLAIASHGRLF